MWYLAIMSDVNKTCMWTGHADISMVAGHVGLVAGESNLVCTVSMAEFSEAGW